MSSGAPDEEGGGECGTSGQGCFISRHLERSETRRANCFAIWISRKSFAGVIVNPTEIPTYGRSCGFRLCKYLSIFAPLRMTDEVAHRANFTHRRAHKVTPLRCTVRLFVHHTKVCIVQISRIGGRASKAPSDGRTRLRGDPSRGLPTKEGGGECGTSVFCYEVLLSYQRIVGGSKGTPSVTTTSCHLPRRGRL